METWAPGCSPMNVQADDERTRACLPPGHGAGSRREPGSAYGSCPGRNRSSAQSLSGKTPYRFRPGWSPIPSLIPEKPPGHLAREDRKDKNKGEEP